MTTTRRGAAGGAAVGRRPCRLLRAAPLHSGDGQKGGWRGSCSWQWAPQGAQSRAAVTTARRGAEGGAATGGRPCRLLRVALLRSEDCQTGGWRVTAGPAGCSEQGCSDDCQKGGLEGRGTAAGGRPCRLLRAAALRSEDSQKGAWSGGCSWQQALQGAQSWAAVTTARMGARWGLAVAEIDRLVYSLN